MANIAEFKQVIKTLNNIQEGVKIERFKFTVSESNALDFAIDFMQRSIEDESEK